MAAHSPLQSQSSQISTWSVLVHRVRAEFLEMPGLKLSLAQAQRLWNLDAATTRTVLAALVDSGFLRCTPKGLFVMVSSATGSMRTASGVRPRDVERSLAGPQSRG